MKVLPTLLTNFLLAAMVCGCATAHRFLPLDMDGTVVAPDAAAQAERTLASLFPARYRAVHRAIIRVGREQFTCDGVLTASPEQGHDLAVVSNLGVVSAVRAGADGDTEVRQVTPLFREEWSRRYVARDVRWLFVAPRTLIPAGRLADGRIVLQTQPAADGTRARYVFDGAGARLQMVELIRGERPFWRAEVLRNRTYGGASELPAEFRIQAGAYQLELRIVQLTVMPAETAEKTEVQR